MINVNCSYSKETGTVVIVNEVKYSPEKCCNFKKGDLLYNPFWGNDKVSVVPKCTLSISDYNLLLDCYKLVKKPSQDD